MQIKKRSENEKRWWLSLLLTVLSSWGMVFPLFWTASVVLPPLVQMTVFIALNILALILNGSSFSAQRLNRAVSYCRINPPNETGSTNLATMANLIETVRMTTAVASEHVADISWEVACIAEWMMDMVLFAAEIVWLLILAWSCLTKFTTVSSVVVAVWLLEMILCLLLTVPVAARWFVPMKEVRTIATHMLLSAFGSFAVWSLQSASLTRVLSGLNARYGILPTRPTSNKYCVD
jgi:hypothetical protein